MNNMFSEFQRISDLAKNLEVDLRRLLQWYVTERRAVWVFEKDSWKRVKGDTTFEHYLANKAHLAEDDLIEVIAFAENAALGRDSLDDDSNLQWEFGPKIFVKLYQFHVFSTDAVVVKNAAKARKKEWSIPTSVSTSTSNLPPAKPGLRRNVKRTMGHEARRDAALKWANQLIREFKGELLDSQGQPRIDKIILIMTDSDKKMDLGGQKPLGRSALYNLFSGPRFRELLRPKHAG